VVNNKRAVDCCQAAGIPLLCGPYHSALGNFSGAGATADEWRRGVDSMREMAEHAAKCHVTLAVEYLNRFECYLLNCAKDAVRFVRDVDHPSCRTMYDTFHAHIEEKNVTEAIRECAPYMAHVHISENDRSTPGAGLVEWKATFDTLRDCGYDGWLMIEAFGLSLPKLAAATKIWRRMYESEEQLADQGLAFMKREWLLRS
jgi:D-psicose/D-tagatose/L-ribulose 3-epimerase